VSTTWQETELQGAEAPRRRPWWRRWLRRALTTLLLVAAGAGAYFAYRHYRTVAALDEALAALDRDERGWRLKDIEAKRVQVPEGENSARVVIAANGLLPRGWPVKELDDRFAKVAAPEQLDPATFALLGKELDRARPAVAEARKLATRPNGRHPLTIPRNPMVALFPTQQDARQAARLLMFDVARQAQTGDMKQALASCRAGLNAARSIGDEPFIISQLIRTACGAVACQSVERALSQGEAAADDLLALQRLLQHEAAFPALLVSMRGERALIHETLDALESGDVPLGDVLDGEGREARALRRLIPGWWLRDTFRADHPRVLALMTRQVAIAQRPPHEQVAAEQELTAERRNLPWDAIATRLLLPAVEKIGVTERRRLAHVRCMIVAVAAERYRLEHGAWPESPEKLAPGLLTEVPLDPFDGKPLRYRRFVEGVVVYSVGEDGKDDGGQVWYEEFAKPKDVGWRLWDVKHRRQPPRPPAQPPEGPGAPGGPPR
jgi:hypothetical protein